jgi:hypothetical protein
MQIVHGACYLPCPSGHKRIPAQKKRYLEDTFLFDHLVEIYFP